MRASEGVCYIAFGDAFLDMARRSLGTLRRFEPSIPAVILTDRATSVALEPKDSNLQIVQLDMGRKQNRAVKTQLPNFVPFERCLYLDADTVILRPIRPIFKHLEAFDLCVSFCGYCINAAVGHLTPEDKEAMLTVCPADALHYQCGVICWRRNAETLDFFRAWHDEWNRFRMHDQGAFARAVWRTGVRLGVLWRDEWNALVPTLHIQVRIKHYVERKSRSLGETFPQATEDTDSCALTPSSSRRVELHEGSVRRLGHEQQDNDQGRRAGAIGEPAVDHGTPSSRADRLCPQAGVCYVAVGDESFHLAGRSLSSLREFEPTLPVTILTDQLRPPPGSVYDENVRVKEVAVQDRQGHSIRTQIPFHIEYERCLVLESDTVILQPITPIFAHLEAFDLCLAFDPRGVLRETRHLSREERALTFALCTDSSLFYEPGVVCWNRTEALLDFYRVWHAEWTKFGQHVEGALARAIWRSKVRVGVLWPGVWNHSRPSADLRILRPTERFPETADSAVLISLAAQAVFEQRREAQIARDRLRNR